MKIMQGYQFRLEPKHKHLSHLNQALGANRFIWNKLLAMNLFRLQNKQSILWYNEMAWFIALWKKSDEYDFLNLAPSQSLQQTAKALERAFKDAFDKNQPNKRIPTFKRLGKNEAGIKYPQGVLLDSGNSVIKLPKLGWVKYRNSGKVLGKIKNVTISRKSGYFTLSIQTERELQTPIHQSKTAVGIDMGIVHFATLSTGEQIAPINSFKQLSETLAKAQRKLKHKVKFSANWQKQQAKVRKLHMTIANVRNNFLHQTSSAISKNHAMIVMEDLKVVNMSRSNKGTTEAHGKQVAQKSGLNRSILDQGWGEFRRQIEYKQSWAGGITLFVPARHTSQTCHACGHVDKDNRKTQDEFVCTACGYTENADINAAKNILVRGHQVLNANDQQTKKQNRGTRGVSLRSESRQRSATETNLTQSLQAA
jgi:putative transposase